ncbi:glycosyltransferase family 4 protein [Mediterraneibacter sp. NSJ-55]|uniref:Glycosyltransferase family 4 protein n=1 Tax=Mediterraneibacter hominis TaxID=2763054 RepID=A0A923LF29_9FIRM|nr:glycosyltransferase family 4 protein [Mediterraneibacter hominis]MBC5687517.1 glycosyltransferase family 4 protein [Mediterraneibacter hominis]
MNIWIVNHYAIPPSMGGLVRHYYFSKYLQKKGHTVKIFTSSKIHNTDINMIKDKSLYREEMEDGVEYTFVRSRDYKGNGLDRIINMMDLPFKTWKTMKLFYKKQKPDVIYTSSPDLFVAYFALLFGRKHKIPVVVEVRDLWPKSVVEYNKLSEYNPIILILYQLEKWIYKKADKLIFTMEGWKNYFTERGLLSEIDLKKVNYINNGVDIEEFERNKKTFKYLDLDLDDKSKFKFVYMGSIRLANNLQSLIEAAKVIKEKGIANLQILVFGDGTEKEALEQESKRCGLNIVFKGKVEKKYIPYILSKSDVNLVNVKSTNIKNYGCSWNKLFEYMASGKPVLSNVYMQYDLISRFNIGIAKEFQSAEEYAKVMIEFSNLDTNIYAEMCNNAKAVAQKFDYKYLTEKIEHVLYSAVSN